MTKNPVQSVKSVAQNQSNVQGVRAKIQKFKIFLITLLATS